MNLRTYTEKKQAVCYKCRTGKHTKCDKVNCPCPKCKPVVK